MHCVGTSANIDCDSKYNLVFPKCLYSCYFPDSYETPSTIVNCNSCFSLLISFKLAHSLVVGSVSVLSAKCRMACTKKTLCQLPNQFYWCHYKPLSYIPLLLQIFTAVKLVCGWYPLEFLAREILHFSQYSCTSQQSG